MYENLMESVVSDENYKLALQAVKRNKCAFNSCAKGAAGIDRMTTTELEPLAQELKAHYLQANWWILKDKLLKGTYVPSPWRKS
jgi:hypothetical protein